MKGGSTETINMMLAKKFILNFTKKPTNGANQMLFGLWETTKETLVLLTNYMLPTWKKLVG